MSRIIRAEITPNVLSWARERLKMSVDEAAKRAKLKTDLLNSWEKGESQPTIRQARIVAKTYRIPFASLYLPTPPDEPIILPHDFRRISGSIFHDISPEIISLIQDAWERREFTLEIFGIENISPKHIRKALEISEDAEESGSKLRNHLNISFEKQRSWHDKRIGFNHWRNAVENIGVLVFQESGININELRGISINTRPLPIILINRSDSYSGRSFTLIHELTHILLQSEGICNLIPSLNQSPEEQQLEIYCNAVTAACLIPASELLKHPLLQTSRPLDGWSDNEIFTLSIYFSVSREAIVRRLLTLKRTSKEFYEQKRRDYKVLPRKKKPTKGHIPPPADVLSRLGRPFVGTILNAYNNKSVTTSDASEYLGLRGKHFTQLAEMIGTS